MHKRCATSSLFYYYYYSYSRYGMGTGICPSGLLLKLLGRYRLCLVSLGANTQDMSLFSTPSPPAALGGGRGTGPAYLGPAAGGRPDFPPRRPS